MVRAAILMLLVFCGFQQGCADSVTRVEMLDIGVAGGPPGRELVPVYEAGTSRPPRAVLPFAKITVSGNAHCDREYLHNVVSRRARDLGADVVLVNPPQVAYAGTVTTAVSAYSAVSQPVYGVGTVAFACVWAPARIGVQWDEQYKVLDVTPRSPAARAGVRIGDRLLAINGERVTGDQFAAYRAVAKLKPGDAVPVEFVGPDNQTRTLLITAEPNA